MFAENNYDPANVFIIPNLYQKEEQKISTLYNFFGIAEIFWLV